MIHSDFLGLILAPASIPRIISDMLDGSPKKEG